MKRIIALVLLSALFTCLLCACGSNVPETGHAEISFTGEPTDVLLEVRMEDKRSAMDGGPNVLSAHKWVVKYNGDVSYIYTSGHGSTNKDIEGGFTENEIATIIDIIQNQNSEINETFDSSYEYWEIDCFSNGDKVKTIGGFVDNNTDLMKLTEMLTGVWNTRR